MTCESANKLFNLCQLCEAVPLPAETGGRPKFTSDWSLMARVGLATRSPRWPSFSQDFPTNRLSFPPSFLVKSFLLVFLFFVSFEMCHASPTRAWGWYVSIYFCCGGPSLPCNEYMGHWVRTHNGFCWCGNHRDTPTQRVRWKTYGPNPNPDSTGPIGPLHHRTKLSFCRFFLLAHFMVK